MKTDMHIHSDFSDGANSPEDIVTAAIDAGYETICITDHVRRESEWLGQFKAEMDRLRREYGSLIRLYSAMETKVMDFSGAIDAREEFFPMVDFVYAAIHRIPAAHGFMTGDEIEDTPGRALENWFRAMAAVLDNPRVQVIVHPGHVFHKRGIAIPVTLYTSLAEKAARRNVAFEVNLKYRVPGPDELVILRKEGVRLTTGSDAHSVKEMLAYAGWPDVPDKPAHP